MDTYTHYTYGEQLATQLKAISHSDQQPRFFRATEQTEIEELNQRLSAACGTLLIAIDGTEATFDWQNADSLMQQPYYLFAVVSQTDATDVASIFAAQQLSQQVAMQLIARMMQDYHACEHGLDLLDPASFRMKGFGPIADNYYGVLLSFSLNRGIDYRIDKTMWH